MKNYVSALIIALGIVGLGLCIKCGISSFADRNRVVAVRGLAEMQVKANKVTWPVMYKVVGNDLQSLYTQLEQSNNIVIKYLTSNGIGKDEYTVCAPSVTDNQASYSYQPQPYRYSITATITVASDQVDLVRTLINRQGELMKQGIAIADCDWNNQIIYEYTELNEVKPGMIADATRKAREAAQKFAEDSGSKIGKIQSAQQGQFSIEDRDPYTPFIKNIRVVTYINFYIED